MLVINDMKEFWCKKNTCRLFFIALEVCKVWSKSKSVTWVGLLVSDILLKKKMSVFIQYVMNNNNNYNKIN